MPLNRSTPITAVCVLFLQGKVSPCRCLGLILRGEREVQFTCDLDAQLYSDLIMSPSVRIVSAICLAVLATSASLVKGFTVCDETPDLS